ncbi:FAD-binding oxidoreductase [Novosphingobium sp. Gsoil 351]|uniref:NAD(P)/FAD-dependent oxidoreductase n=1 Tax=Novosphingobium sp. Gsoil 351 TaxID=2675225 RepID=UPI0018A84E50|nr:FAD-dependent oxidoreductase [Novosphingobium sp. Gsoil 351]
MDDVAVIGAGIAGLATALNLQERGRSVKLYDPLGVGLGCSWGSGGLINPDAHLPVAMPGMIRNVPRWLLDPLAPLAVRPADALASLPFLARWLLASRPAAVREGVDALRALHRNTLREYRMLLGDAYPDHVHERGGITLLIGEQPSPAERLAAELRRELGIVCEELDRREIEARVPGIASHARRALYFPGNAHTPDPAALCVALGDRFREQGGAFRSIKVDRIVAGDDFCTLWAGGEAHLADQVVVAAGARTPTLVKPLGLKIPLVAERGYHLQLVDPSLELSAPMIYREGGFALTPMRGGMRLGGTVEIADADAPPNYARAEALWGRAQRLFPGLTAADKRPWMGSRPALPDSVPAIGRLLRAPRVAIVAGHGHDGMIGGPASGRLVSELICGQATHIEHRPYRPDRFGWSTVLRQAW